jgi:hypothetical protein
MTGDAPKRIFNAQHRSLSSSPLSDSKDQKTVPITIKYDTVFMFVAEEGVP